MYAFLTDDLLAVKTWDALSDASYASLVAAANPKATRYRLQSVDVVPVVAADQTYFQGPFVIEDALVRQTWVVRSKTAQELAADDAQAERQQIADRIDKLNVSIDAFQALLDVPYVEPPAAGTNAAEIAALRDRMRLVERNQRDIWRDLILTMKSVRGELRQTKQAL